MQTFIRTYSLAFALLLGMNALAQEPSKRTLLADSLYALQRFDEALPIYKRQWKKSEEQNLHAARQMAKCYEKLGENEKAVEGFHSLVQKEHLAEDLFAYAQLLRADGKYAQADFVMEEFSSKAKNDSRTYSFAMNKAKFKNITEGNTDTHVSTLKSNSRKSDFGITYGPDATVAFVSAREKGVPTTRIYTRTDEPFLDLFFATAAEDGSLENIRSAGKEVNSAFHEGNCTFSADGNTMYFTRNAAHKGQKGKLVRLEIYSAQKVDGEWTNVQPFKWNHESYSAGHPTLSKDGRKLYFVSDRRGGFGGTDLYVCNLQADSTWSRPGNMGQIVNTEGNELFPYMHPDDVLYFASDGHYGIGGLDLFVSPLRDGRCKEVTNLGAPYNSPQDDMNIIFNENRHKGYFSSNRDGGTDNIYHFEVDYDRPSAVKGLVVDNETAKPMANAIAQLYNAEGELMEEKKVDANGEFLFFLDKMECNYYVRVVNEDGWTVFESAPTPCTYVADPINLGKVSVANKFWKAAGSVKNKVTKEPIEDFVVTLVNMDNGNTEVKNTSELGQVTFSLQPEMQYNIVFEKEGYFTRSGEFDTKGMEPGVLSIERFVQLFFEPLEVDKAIEIENIYFGYDKYEVTAASARALDNVVTTMQRNPEIVVEMGSHTDSRGTVDYNMWLCNERAKAVTNYLKSKGIAPERLISKGYGESQLINTCRDGVECSEAQHKQNRRIEFKVIQMDAEE